MIIGERKRLSNLKPGSYFVFTDRKNMPCLYNGISSWNNHTIYLWTELKRFGCWTQAGSEIWVIDYKDELPDNLESKFIKFRNEPFTGCD